MKAALYVRVSTEDQAREGFSIPAQIKALREYCYKNDIKIFNEYIDEGISGTREDRPQFQLMIKDGLKSKYDIILVHKFDRFARKVELSQRIKNQLKNANINVVSITEPLEDSPMGFFVGGLHELLAEYYIKNLSNEVKKGQNEKVSQGYVLNRLCYGYKNVNGVATVVEEQAQVVRLIFDMFNSGKGTLVIANWLNDHGIPTMECGKWNTSQINYMLKNITYTGVMKWSGKLYDGIVPEIIDKEYFMKTQSKIIPHKQPKRKEHYDRFLLLGILYCGYCGAPMRISRSRSNGNRNGKVYYMYTCSKARYDKNACSFTRHFERSRIEKTFLSNAVEIINGTNTDFSIYRPSTIEEVLEERKSKIINELNRAKKAYLEEVFTLEEYKSEKDRLENELKLIQLDEKQNNVLSNKAKVKMKTLWDEYKNETTIPGKKSKLQEIFREVKIFQDCLTVELYG